MLTAQRIGMQQARKIMSCIMRSGPSPLVIGAHARSACSNVVGQIEPTNLASTLKRRNRLQQSGELDGRHNGENRGDEDGGDLAAGESRSHHADAGRRRDVKQRA